MYRYIAFGLRIHSEVPLPELVAGDGGADVDLVIRRGKVGRPPIENSWKYLFWATNEGTCVLWQEVGTFRIRGGTEIVIDSAPGVDEQRLRVFLLGPVMGVLLHQRGLLVLHASAVALNGHAVLFLGGKGQGKSTMAAALHNRGHNAMSDDLVALDFDGVTRPSVLPAFPRLKLWPDAVLSLGEDPEALPRLSSLLDKRNRVLTSGFSPRPAPVGCIYLLSIGSHLDIEHVRPQQATIELLRSLYAMLIAQKLRQPGEASHFLQCAEIARSVPVYRLNRPRSLQLVPVIARLVEEHLASDVFAATA